MFIILLNLTVAILAQALCITQVFLCLSMNEEPSHTVQLLHDLRNHDAKENKEKKNKIRILEEFYYTEIDIKLNNLIELIKFRIKEYNIIFQISKYPREILNIFLSFYHEYDKKNNKSLSSLRIQYEDYKKKRNKAIEKMTHAYEQYIAA